MNKKHQSIITLIKSPSYALRITRMVLGSTFVIIGLVASHGLTGVFGGILVAQSLLNVGCCSLSACAAPPVNPKKFNSAILEEVEFREIK